MGVRGSMCEESDRNGLEHFCPWSGVKPPYDFPLPLDQLPSLYMMRINSTGLPYFSQSVCRTLPEDILLATC